MLDFQAVREKKITLQDLVKDLTKDDLRRELNEMVDKIQRRIANAADAAWVAQIAAVKLQFIEAGGAIRLLEEGEIDRLAIGANIAVGINKAPHVKFAAVGGVEETPGTGLGI